jgi:hypothetical protein
VTTEIALFDNRRLDLLNRKERQHYNKLYRGEYTMQINLLAPIEATDADATIIMNKEGKPPTLKEILLFALRSPHQADTQTGFREKNERYLVLKRVDAVDSIELTEGEVKMILDRVGKLYLQVELVGKVAEALSAKPPTAAVDPTQVPSAV